MSSDVTSSTFQTQFHISSTIFGLKLTSHRKTSLTKSPHKSRKPHKYEPKSEKNIFSTQKSKRKQKKGTIFWQNVRFENFTFFEISNFSKIHIKFPFRLCKSKCSRILIWSSERQNFWIKEKFINLLLENLQKALFDRLLVSMPFNSHKVSSYFGICESCCLGFKFIFTLPRKC